MRTDDSMGQSVIASRLVRVSAERQRIGPPLEEGAEPTVELIRDGDAIIGVEVVCACGKRVRVRFEY